MWPNPQETVVPPLAWGWSFKNLRVKNGLNFLNKGKMVQNMQIFWRYFYLLKDVKQIVSKYPFK